MLVCGPPGEKLKTVCGQGYIGGDDCVEAETLSRPANCKVCLELFEQAYWPNNGKVETMVGSKAILSVGDLMQIRESLETSFGIGFRSVPLYEKIDALLEHKNATELSLDESTFSMEREHEDRR